MNEASTTASTVPKNRSPSPAQHCKLALAKQPRSGENTHIRGGENLVRPLLPATNRLRSFALRQISWRE